MRNAHPFSPVMCSATFARVQVHPSRQRAVAVTAFYRINGSVFVSFHCQKALLALYFEENLKHYPISRWRRRNQ